MRHSTDFVDRRRFNWWKLFNCLYSIIIANGKLFWKNSFWFVKLIKKTQNSTSISIFCHVFCLFLPPSPHPRSLPLFFSVLLFPSFRLFLFRSLNFLDLFWSVPLRKQILCPGATAVKHQTENHCIEKDKHAHNRSNKLQCSQIGINWRISKFAVSHNTKSLDCFHLPFISQNKTL